MSPPLRYIYLVFKLLVYPYQARNHGSTSCGHTRELLNLTLLFNCQVTDIHEAMESLECILDNKDHTHQLHIPGTSEVSAKLSLPLDRLIGYLKEQHGLEGGERKAVLRQFRHGQSNPTYYLSYGGEEIVLRKKPVR